jgi:hypothetical protein
LSVALHQGLFQYINLSVDQKVLTMPLTAQELPKKVLGKYSDGGGLLFRVTRGGTRDWFLKVQYKGKRKEYALGKYPDLGLSDARAKAREWRSLIKAGIDPRNPYKRTQLQILR